MNDKKNFVCSLDNSCQKDFKHKSSLIRHMNKEHKNKLDRNTKSFSWVRFDTLQLQNEIQQEHEIEQADEVLDPAPNEVELVPQEKEEENSFFLDRVLPLSTLRQPILFSELTLRQKKLILGFRCLKRLKEANQKRKQEIIRRKKRIELLRQIKERKKQRRLFFKQWHRDQRIKYCPEMETGRWDCRRRMEESGADFLEKYEGKERELKKIQVTGKGKPSELVSRLLFQTVPSTSADDVTPASSRTPTYQSDSDE